MSETPLLRIFALVRGTVEHIRFLVGPEPACWATYMTFLAESTVGLFSLFTIVDSVKPVVDVMTGTRTLLNCRTMHCPNDVTGSKQLFITWSSCRFVISRSSQSERWFIIALVPFSKEYHASIAPGQEWKWMICRLSGNILVMNHSVYDVPKPSSRKYYEPLQ